MQLHYLGHRVVDNRLGLEAGVELTLARGCAQRKAAIAMLERSDQGLAALGAGRANAARDFDWGLRDQWVTPRIALNNQGGEVRSLETRNMLACRAS